MSISHFYPIAKPRSAASLPCVAGTDARVSAEVSVIREIAA
jgi:hypothetical protein